MKLLKHRGGEAVTIILIIIIVVFLIGYLINIGARECKSDAHCGSGYYCGSDFACHQIPTIEKTLIKNNFLIPSVIIGLAIVIAAIILKWQRSPFRKSKDDEETKQKENPLKLP
jgi:hypothetical protein|tara:strand:- start:662 stop:1003 length:342 start_codon:yes stop_codon:yes gene_type:complete